MVFFLFFSLYILVCEDTNGFALFEVCSAVMVTIASLMEADALYLRFSVIKKYRNFYHEGQVQLGELIKFVDWTGMRRRQLYKGNDPKVLIVIKQFVIIESQKRLSPVRKGRKYIWWYIYGYGFLRLSIILFMSYQLLQHY